MARGEGERGVSDEAAAKATGRTWDTWFRLLDAWGAEERPHKDIARYLRESHGVSPWWSQMVTVEYERARGLRDVGETKGGYSISVQRTLPMPRAAAWVLFLDPRTTPVWFDTGQGFPEAAGTSFELDDGTAGEVRVLDRPQRLRFTWQPPSWSGPSIVDVTFQERPGDKTAVRVQHDRLPDQETREAMRTRWRAALDALLAES